MAVTNPVYSLSQTATGSGWLQQSARGMKTMPTVTTKDGVGILYKDWRPIRPKLQR
jgi:hypothetical protein